MKLPHSLERAVLVPARRATLFSFFTDNARFAAWWGEGSTIEPRPGGELAIRYPNGVVAGGEVVELAANDRVVFTFGYESGRPMPVGASHVTVTLADRARGTEVALRHDFGDAGARDQHVPGWRFQLAQLANLGSAMEHQDLDARVDRFFALWTETDPEACARGLVALCSEQVAFADPHAALASRDELAAHIATSQQFMPGVRLQRRGPPRHCQGTVLVDWQMVRDGEPLGQGTNVFELLPDGRIARVVGVPAAD